MGRGGNDGNPRFYEGVFLRDNSTNKINFGQSLRADLYKGLSLTVSGQLMFDEGYYEGFNKDHQISKNFLYESDSYLIQKNIMY